MAASGGYWKSGNFVAAGGTSKRPQLFGNPESAENVGKVTQYARSRGYTVTRGDDGYYFQKPGQRGRIFASKAFHAIPDIERG